MRVTMAAIWNTGAIWMKFRIYGYFYVKSLITERHGIFNQTVRQFGFFIEKTMNTIVAIWNGVPIRTKLNTYI